MAYSNLIPQSLGVIMKKLHAATALALIASSGLMARPILISDLDPEQLYSQAQINQQIQSVKYKSSASLSDLQKEYLAIEKIKTMDAAQLSHEDLGYLNKASSYQSKSFRLHDEGPLPVAIFDVASQAKFKLQQHFIAKELAALDALKASNQADYLNSLVSNSDLDSAAIQIAKVQSLNSLTQQQAKNLATDLLKTRSLSDPLLIKSVEQARDFDLSKQLLIKLNNHDAHRQLDALSKQFTVFEQEALLTSVINNNQYLASQALAQYAQLPVHVRVNTLLLDKLQDPTLGASAAKAIALTSDHQLFEQLASLAVEKNASRLQVANALSGLRFAEGDYARSLLTEIVKNKQIAYADMAQEVTKWLD